MYVLQSFYVLKSVGILEQNVELCLLWKSVFSQYMIVYIFADAIEKIHFNKMK